MTAGGSGGVLDPGSAMERLRQWQGRIEKLASDTQVMSGRLKDLRVTASGADGLVEVTVDSAGGLVGLWLSQRIHHVAPDAVARTIMETIRKAKGQLADRSTQIITETVGTGPAAQAVAARVGEQLRGPEPTADDDQQHRW